MEIKIDRFEVKQKSPQEYGIKDHTTDAYIVTLNTKDYGDAGNKLVELKNVIDEAISNGDLHL